MRTKPKAIREAARGQECQLRLTGICSHDSSTVVLAHIRRCGNAGVGQKPPNVSGIFACDRCHSVLDGRAGKLRAHDSDILEGMLRTHKVLKEMGLVE